MFNLLKAVCLLVDLPSLYHNYYQFTTVAFSNQCGVGDADGKHFGGEFGKQEQWPETLESKRPGVWDLEVA